MHVPNNSNSKYKNGTNHTQGHLSLHHSIQPKPTAYGPLKRKTVILSGTMVNKKKGKFESANMVKKSYKDKMYLDKMPYTLPSRF